MESHNTYIRMYVVCGVMSQGGRMIVGDGRIRASRPMAMKRESPTLDFRKICNHARCDDSRLQESSASI